jgi:hypothetical protein
MILADMMNNQPKQDGNERPTGSRAVVVSFALALGASVALLFVPSGTEVSACLAPATGASASAPTPACRTSVSHPSLLDVEGPRVLVPLAIPVAVAGLALGLRRSRISRAAAIAAGCLLFAFVVLGAFSIGVFYMPSAVAMFVGSRASSSVPVPV